MTDPFPWNSDGEGGYEVPVDFDAMIHHEVLYEEEISSIDDSGMNVGESIPRNRFRLFQFAIVACALVLLGRAGWIQIKNYDVYAALAERNQYRREVLPARRGLVRDRDGVILAENIPSFDVHIQERFLPQDPSAREELLGKLGREIGMSVGEMEQAIQDAPDSTDQVLLQRDIPYENALAVHILASDQPAINIVTGHKRKYSLSDETRSLSHILGYVGVISADELDTRKDEGYRQVDQIGKTGIESSYESALRGVHGERLFEVDSRNEVTSVVEERLPVDGQEVTLTLDADLQEAAETAMERVLENRDVKRGVAIAMNPQTGAILAVVSWPAYDNNLFSGRVSSTAYAALIEDESHPLLPRAWAGTYPSGSTIKPVVATAGLEEGVITPRTSIFSSGGIGIGPWFFPDWKAGGHGSTNVRFAIAWSVNTFFYHVGGGYRQFVGLGLERLANWFRNFGFGSETHIDIPGERTGFVPSETWKLETKGERWFIGDTYNLSIGQGDLLVTPLQIARMTSVVANGGMKVTPHFVDSGQALGERVAAEETIETVRAGMRDTVVYGSGRALAGFPVPVSGKTGTAQWRSDKDNHAWFTSFAPYENPEIVVTVLVEEGEEGSATAVPVARDILWAWLGDRDGQQNN